MKEKPILRVTAYFFLILVALTTLFPFYLMVVMGTHTNQDLFRNIQLWFGKELLTNLRTLMGANFPLYFLNSLIVSLPNVFVTCLSCSMGGYALAKFNFKGKKAVMTFIFITLMLPSNLGLIAWVWQMKQLGWLNTYYPFIIPAMGNTFGVFWLSQFASDAVPMEVIESARVDGCNEFKIYYKIALPFMMAGVVALGLLQFVGSWNNYMGPLIILKNPKKYTIPLGIATLGSLFRIEYSSRILGMTIGSLPLIILFSLTSKYFMLGVTGGAIKG